VYSEHFQLLATIRPPLPAGVASLAIQIRLDRAAVSRLQTGHICPDSEHFDAQFVPRDPRIAEKRKLAEIRGDIGPTNADAMHLDERFPRPRRRRLVDLDRLKPTGLLELDSFH
jgi:hypothetical protein